MREEALCLVGVDVDVVALRRHHVALSAGAAQDGRRDADPDVDVMLELALAGRLVREAVTTAVADDVDEEGRLTRDEFDSNASHEGLLR